MENLKPNGKRAKTAITLIWIVLALEILSLISSYFKYDLLQTIKNGGEISKEIATSIDISVGIIWFLYLIAYIISIVTFIKWFRRAYYNLHLRVNNLLYNEGWAAGSWFVPFINLYRPYRIMNELYQKTIELLTKKGIGFNQSFNSYALWWWWLLWIINNYLGQAVYRNSMNAESINELTESTINIMIVNIIGILLALITIKVIKDYSNVEPLLNEIKDEEEKTTE